MANEQKSGLAVQIENEIQDYLTGIVTISEGNDYSQYKLVKRIVMFENHFYPRGKVDSQGNYKFWYDVISPSIDAEIKNIDFDTKDIEIHSDRRIDELPVVISNLKLKEWLRDTGQAEELNSAIEEGSGWGNVLWKKIKGSYERTDLKNVCVVNQTAECVNETAIIERHCLSQSDLREKQSSYKYVPEVLKECKQNSYASSPDATPRETTTPFYEIYERNGEVCLKDLKEALSETPAEGDEEKYVLAKVIAAGKKGNANAVQIKYILYADYLKGKLSDVYKEYHRGRYKGKWFREGLYELLFDIQVRGNQIGNQIAQGLEWASKVLFRSKDRLIIQNILSDLKNGDLIRSEDIQQINVRMEGFDQLIADWNRLIELRNEIANSREIVQGGDTPANMPFKLGNLLNINANKLFEFLREKLAIPFSEIFEQWIVPEMVKNLSSKEVLRLTGDSDMMDRLNTLIVDSWYNQNLVYIGPHTKEFADTIKQDKLDELKKRPQLLMNELDKVWEGFKPAVSVVITGENSRKGQRLESLSTFIPLETDPIRRTALVEMAMKESGFDVGGLPKTDQMALQQAQMTERSNSQSIAKIPVKSTTIARKPVSAGV